MLDFLEYFDLIKWLDDLFCTAKNGRGVLLEWSATSVAGSDVEALLRRYGVKVYARRYAKDGTAGCHVRTAQAKYADGLLRGYGVPVLSKQLSKPIRPRRAWGVPATAQGIAGAINQSMDGDSTKRRPRRSGG